MICIKLTPPPPSEKYDHPPWRLRTTGLCTPEPRYSSYPSSDTEAGPPPSPAVSPCGPPSPPSGARSTA